jgi:transposase IS116/IS110/IS902 family protein
MISAWLCSSFVPNRRPESTTRIQGDSEIIQGDSESGARIGPQVDNRNESGTRVRGGTTAFPCSARKGRKSGFRHDQPPARCRMPSCLGHADRRRFAALMGAAPINRDSGARYGTRQTGGGRAQLRATLYVAALGRGTPQPSTPDWLPTASVRKSPWSPACTNYCSFSMPSSGPISHGTTNSLPRRSDPKPNCGRDAGLMAEAAEGGGA